VRRKYGIDKLGGRKYYKSVDTNITGKEKKARRKYPLSVEIRRDGWYKFRVNQVERELLEEVGDSTFWRSFCLYIATLTKYRDRGASLDSIQVVIDITRMKENEELIEYWKQKQAKEVESQLQEIATGIIDELDEEMKVDDT
jgi:hypothetical protein